MAVTLTRCCLRRDTHRDKSGYPQTVAAKETHKEAEVNAEKDSDKESATKAAHIPQRH